MTTKEADRYAVLSRVWAKDLTQKKAAELLGISDRQIRNVATRVRREGPKGVISRHRGRPGNHCKSKECKQRALALVREKYEGFGPTLAKEKLEEWHELRVSIETLRQWMIEHHLWIPRAKRKRVYLPRQRRECFGELIQADGSHHRWFGEDLPAVNATVLVDDATGTLTSLTFSEQETLDSYYEALRQHITRYGRPRALYTDRYCVFQAWNKKGTTQMQRVLQELDISLILANSPQAKGRVERTNRTLQDRLLREFKLRGIKTIEEANVYAREFMEVYNKKFSKKPMKDFNAHRPLEGYDLDKVFSQYEVRTLLSDCTFQLNNKFYIVQGISNVRRAKGRKVEIREAKDGQIRVFMGENELQVRLLEEIEEPEGVPVLSRKEVLAWKPRPKRAVPESHPWKRYGYHQRMKRYRGNVL